jgi:hypothetical protein
MLFKAGSTPELPVLLYYSPGVLAFICTSALESDSHLRNSTFEP